MITEQSTGPGGEVQVLLGERPRQRRSSNFLLRNGSIMLSLPTQLRTWRQTRDKTRLGHIMTAQHMYSRVNSAFTIITQQHKGIEICYIM